MRHSQEYLGIENETKQYPWELVWDTLMIVVQVCCDFHVAFVRRPKFTKFMYCINFHSVRPQHENCINLCPRGHKLVSTCCIPERYGLYPCISSVFVQLKFAGIICILWIYLLSVTEASLNHY